jgi:hypothetical protein
VSHVLRALGHRHVVDFLLDGRRDAFHVLDSLYRTSGSRIWRFTQGDLDALRRLWERRNGDDGKLAALWLVDALEQLLGQDPMGLRHLALAQIADLLRQRLAEGVASSGLPAEARSLGVVGTEADYLAFAVVESDSKIRRLCDDIADALRGGRVREAERRLGNLAPGTDDPELLDLVEQVRTTVANVETLLGQGAPAESEGDIEAAAGAYLAAGAIARDDPEAAAGLARCRPSAPAELSIEASERSVRLCWPISPSTAGVIDYLVICGYSAPLSPAKDSVVTVTGDLTALDGAAPLGRELWYGVFSRRNGEFVSHSGAQAGPLVLTPGVEGLGHYMRNCRVQLRWDPPESGQVRVARAEAREGDEPVAFTPVPVTERDRVTDVGLTVGITYRYRVVTVFETPGGRQLESAPQIVTVTADVDPIPVNDLVVIPDPQASRIVLRWGPGANGEVQFLEAVDRPAAAAGTLVPVGSVVSPQSVVHKALPGTTSLEIPFVGGKGYVTPVTLRGDVAAVGATRRLVTQPPVTGLSLRRFQAEVRILWQWPPNCAEAIVVVAPDTVPVDDSEGDRHVINRAIYDREGGCRLRLPNRVQGFSVTAVGYEGGQRMLSPPATAVLHAVGGTAEVRYELRRNGIPGRRRWTLRLEASEAVPDFDFVLVARPGTHRPLEASDPLCSEVMRLEGISLRSGAGFETEVSLVPVRRPCYLRGFITGPSADAVELRDPPREHLVLR